MLAKKIIWFGSEALLICDGICEKAWGISSRPQIKLSDNVDDFAYKSDTELEFAPINPGTYEGCDGKPIDKSRLLNKWCARECERSEKIEFKNGIANC